MTQLEVDLPPPSREPVDQTVERLAQSLGLSITLKTTSAKFPGSIHWHLKKGRERGVLEATYWPAQHRLWFNMQDGRSGDWVMPTAERVKEILE